MDDSQIVRAALIVSMLGLLGLIIFSRNSPIEEYSPGGAQLDREVHITGKVVRFQNYGKTAFLKLSHEATTDVTLFKPYDFQLKANDTVTIRGVVEEYKGREQIVAYSIQHS